MLLLVCPVTPERGAFPRDGCLAQELTPGGCERREMIGVGWLGYEAGCLGRLEKTREQQAGRYEGRRLLRSRGKLGTSCAGTAIWPPLLPCRLDAPVSPIDFLLEEFGMNCPSGRTVPGSALVVAQRGSCVRSLSQSCRSRPWFGEEWLECEQFGEACRVPDVLAVMGETSHRLWRACGQPDASTVPGRKLWDSAVWGLREGERTVEADQEVDGSGQPDAVAGTMGGADDCRKFGGKSCDNGSAVSKQGGVIVDACLKLPRRRTRWAVSPPAICQAGCDGCGRAVRVWAEVADTTCGAYVHQITLTR
jgi:hypothetical protein